MVPLAWGGPGLEGFLKALSPLVATLPQNFDAINVSREGKKKKGRRKKKERGEKEKKRKEFRYNSAMCKSWLQFQSSQRFANADLRVKQLVGCI